MTNPAKAAAPAHPRRKRKKHWLQRDWRLYLMLLIPIVWYILFCYKPMARAGLPATPSSPKQVRPRMKPTRPLVRRFSSPLLWMKRLRSPRLST